MVNDGQADSAPDAVVVTVTSPNQPAVATAGPDQTVEGIGPQTKVTLNGADSSDPDGDGLSYSWSGNGAEISTEVSPALSLAMGSHTPNLTVNDGKGASAVDEVVVNLVDTTPPVLILGESGTGKELIAWAVLFLGARQARQVEWGCWPPPMLICKPRSGRHPPYAAAFCPGGYPQYPGLNFRDQIDNFEVKN